MNFGPARWVMEKTMGVTSEREFPAFATETFREWWAARGGAETSRERARRACVERGVAAAGWRGPRVRRRPDRPENRVLPRLLRELQHARRWARPWSACSSSSATRWSSPSRAVPGRRCSPTGCSTTPGATPRRPSPPCRRWSRRDTTRCVRVPPVRWRSARSIPNCSTTTAWTKSRPTPTRRSSTSGSTRIFPSAIRRRGRVSRPVLSRPVSRQKPGTPPAGSRTVQGPGRGHRHRRRRLLFGHLGHLRLEGRPIRRLDGHRRGDVRAHGSGRGDDGPHRVSDLRDADGTRDGLRDSPPAGARNSAGRRLIKGIPAAGPRSRTAQVVSRPGRTSRERALRASPAVRWSRRRPCRSASASGRRRRRGPRPRCSPGRRYGRRGLRSPRLSRSRRPLPQTGWRCRGSSRVGWRLRPPSPPPVRRSPGARRRP